MYVYIKANKSSIYLSTYMLYNYMTIDYSYFIVNICYHLMYGTKRI